GTDRRNGKLRQQDLTTRHGGSAFVLRGASRRFGAAAFRFSQTLQELRQIFGQRRLKVQGLSRNRVLKSQGRRMQRQSRSPATVRNRFAAKRFAVHFLATERVSQF